MKLESLIKKRDVIRLNWRCVRTERIHLKKVLADKNAPALKIRRNAEYRLLKKRQKHLSKMIKHLEKKICREIKNGPAKKD